MKTVSKYVNKFTLSCNCEIIKKISSYIFRVNDIVSKQKDHKKVNNCDYDIFWLKFRSQKILLLESILHISILESMKELKTRCKACPRAHPYNYGSVEDGCVFVYQRLIHWRSKWTLNWLCFIVFTQINATLCWENNIVVVNNPNNQELLCIVERTLHNVFE